VFRALETILEIEKRPRPVEIFLLFSPPVVGRILSYSRINVGRSSISYRADVLDVSVTVFSQLRPDLDVYTSTILGRVLHAHFYEITEKPTPQANIVHVAPRLFVGRRD